MKIIAATILLLLFGSPSGNENGTDAPYPELKQVWRASCPPDYTVVETFHPSDEFLASLTNPVQDPELDDSYYYCRPICGVSDETGEAKTCSLIY